MKMTPEMIKMATSMMSSMSPEDMQRMAAMAPNMSQPGAAPSGASASGDCMSVLLHIIQNLHACGFFPLVCGAFIANLAPCHIPAWRCVICVGNVCEMDTHHAT